MKKQTLKFNDGEITTNFNKTIVVHEDLENNETWLCIPGLPSDDQANKIVRVTPPPLLQKVSVILSLPMTTKEIHL